MLWLISSHIQASTRTPQKTNAICAKLLQDPNATRNVLQLRDLGGLGWLVQGFYSIFEALMSSCRSWKLFAGSLGQSSMLLV